MTIAEYADAMDVATELYIAESQALSATFHGTVEDEIAELAETGEGDLLALATDVTTRETVQYLALLEDAMSRYSESLDTMGPPSTLSEVHDDYVDAIESVRGAMPATRDAVGEAQDLVGIQDAITNSGFSDGQFRLQAACSALEAAVRSEGHGVDLGCAPRPTGS